MDMKADMEARDAEGVKPRPTPNRAQRRAALKSMPRSFRLYAKRQGRRELGLSPR